VRKNCSAHHGAGTFRVGSPGNALGNRAEQPRVTPQFLQPRRAHGFWRDFSVWPSDLAPTTPTERIAPNHGGVADRAGPGWRSLRAHLLDEHRILRILYGQRPDEGYDPTD